MTSGHHDLDTLTKIWQQVLDRTVDTNLQYKISFTGGEVTTNKAFLPLIKWILSVTKDVQIFMTTNGTASLGYYKKLASVINGISFSTHSEFIDEAKFFAKVKALNEIMMGPHKSLHVNIMDEHWNRDRNNLYEKFCSDHRISYSVNQIDYNKSNRQEILRKGTYNIESI